MGNITDTETSRAGERAATRRCDELIIQVVLRTYDTEGRPISETIAPPARVFRSVMPDIWGGIDQHLATLARAGEPEK